MSIMTSNTNPLFNPDLKLELTTTIPIFIHYESDDSTSIYLIKSDPINPDYFENELESIGTIGPINSLDFTIEFLKLIPSNMHLLIQIHSHEYDQIKDLYPYLKHQLTFYNS